MRIDSAGRVTTPSQPAFFAYDTRGYGKVSASDLVCNSFSFNTGSSYNNTNGRFTAPISGRYLFSCNVQGADVYEGGNPYISTIPRVNGSGIGVGEFINSLTSTADHSNLSPTVIVNMNAGDYFTWYCNRGYRSGPQISMTGYLIG